MQAFEVWSTYDIVWQYDFDIDHMIYRCHMSIECHIILMPYDFDRSYNDIRADDMSYGDAISILYAIC